MHLAYVLASLDAVALLLVLAGRHGLHAISGADRTRLTAGDSLTETCRVEKQSIWPAVWLEVEWADGSHGSLAVLGGQTRAVTHECAFLHRGRYLAGGVAVRVRDPLGLAGRIGAWPQPVIVTVYPRPVTTPEAVDAVRALSTGLPRRWAVDADATLGDLRDYVAGDAPSRIHWRTSARRGVLTVADPESRSRRSIWVLADLGGSEDGTEEAAGIAAYLAGALPGRGRQVGAIVAGETVSTVQPRIGESAAAGILDVLAEMPAAPVSQCEPLVEAAARLRDPGSFVIVASDRPPAEVLARRLKALHPRAQVLLAGAGRAAA